MYYRVYHSQPFVLSRATLIQYTPSSSISLQCTLISSCSRIPSLPSGLILYVLPRNIPASKYPFPRVPHPILLDFITLISFFEKSLFVRFSSLSYPNFFRRIKYHSEYPILDKQKEYIYIYTVRTISHHYTAYVTLSTKHVCIVSLSGFVYVSIQLTSDKTGICHSYTIKGA